MAHNDENLHTLISTDLEYLIACPYRWLVKFNPNKNRYYLQRNRMGNIVNKEAPDYLYELVPPLVAANVNYNLRNSHNIHVPLHRLSVYLNSYFPCTIPTWNSLDLTIRNLPTFSSFKLKLQQIFYTKRRNPQYYYIGDRFLSVLHSRMRNKCSALNADLYHANLIVN